MDLAFAFISDELSEFYAPDAESMEAPKPPAEVPPFWWEDYMGRPGKQADPQRCWDATRAMCR